LFAAAALIAGCAASAPVTRSDELTCVLPTNCANSVESSSMPPLRYRGSAADGMKVLRSALAQFPEAQVVAADALWAQTIFTTTLGFRDQVDFVIDPEGQTIDYRSRSLFGLFDFNKNRSRMREIANRFGAIAPR
jgi:uncharacterized protein (DUF1499 family)